MLTSLTGGVQPRAASMTDVFLYVSFITWVHASLWTKPFSLIPELVLYLWLWLALLPRLPRRALLLKHFVAIAPQSRFLPLCESRLHVFIPRDVLSKSKQCIV